MLNMSNVSNHSKFQKEQKKPKVFCRQKYANYQIWSEHNDDLKSKQFT